ncbi:helix-turn-helix transcriptional regulator [Nocardia sp. AG03]|uniref:helix-turn-helix transcriptional regulator n=1 Tax=Nocardia sp. AG03 TaxID=3025312 RepID=UPI00241886F7|nr:helix-turn-helix transcriptional regulator [Nocardia sp. AG03]
MRNEHVAGVGVTWYTWLEQGRPINASVQVLDAVARVLGLDVTERAHLYRLAGVTVPTGGEVGVRVAPGVPAILGQLGTMPAVLLDSKFEVLDCNDAYRRVFPSFGEVGRNVLRGSFLLPECCNPYPHNAGDLRRMVAYLRGAYAQRMDDARWQALVEEMCGASVVFAEYWASNDVAPAGDLVKLVWNPVVGELRMNLTVLAVPGSGGAWIQVFAPVDEVGAGRVGTLLAMSDDQWRRSDEEHGRSCAERVAVAEFDSPQHATWTKRFHDRRMCAVAAELEGRARR